MATTDRAVPAPASATDARGVNPTTKKAKRKAPAKKKASAKKKAPAKKKKVDDSVVMFPGISDEKTNRKILADLTAGRKIRAIQKFRLATGLGLKESLGTVSKIWAENQTRLIDTANYPRKCCFNCLGGCANKASIVKNHGVKLWDLNTSSPLGVVCSQFIDQKMLDKIEDNGKLTFRNSANDRIIEIFWQKPILKINRQGQRRSGSIKPSEESFILSNSAFKKKLSSLLTEFFSSGVTFSVSGVHTEDLRVNGLAPKVSESWAEYVQRAEESARTLRQTNIEKFKDMTDPRLKAHLGKYFKAHGAGYVIEMYNNDVQKIIEDYFPDKTLDEVCIILENAKVK